MKRIIFPLILLLTVIAGSAQSLTDRADKAYSDEDYSTAISLYQQALADEGSSSLLFYNLGNAYYRADSIAQSIISYERALMLDPTNTDARTNLEFVNTKIIDTPGDTSSYSTLFIDKAMTLMSPNSWGWTSVVIFAIVLVLVGGYILSINVKTRKICFFTGITMIFICAGSIILTLMGTSRSSNHNHGVITAVSTQLSTTPAPALTARQQAFLLHEGCKVEIVDSVSTPLDPTTKMWYEVKVDNEHRAWVSANDIERI